MTTRHPTQMVARTNYKHAVTNHYAKIVHEVTLDGRGLRIPLRWCQAGWCKGPEWKCGIASSRVVDHHGRRALGVCFLGVKEWLGRAVGILGNWLVFGVLSFCLCLFHAWSVHFRYKIMANKRNIEICALCPNKFPMIDCLKFWMKTT